MAANRRLRIAPVIEPPPRPIEIFDGDEDGEGRDFLIASYLIPPIALAVLALGRWGGLW